MKRIGLLLALCFSWLGYGQTEVSLQTYIDSALVNNIVLQQKNMSLQQAEYALKSAKGLFLPKVEVLADYTSATGGRNINLPLGDLLNGAYATLNQLTQSHNFPQLENQSINFLPSNYYDARVRASVPIVNAGMWYNKQIKAQQMQLSAEDLAIYKRELVETVKVAYFHYFQAKEAVEIYRSALHLAQEGKRVNQKLVDNGKGLPAYVLRAESEIAKVQVKLTAAEQKVDQSQRYFNFLLNRSEQAKIEGNPLEKTVETEILKSLGQDISIANREEIGAFQEQLALQESLLKLDKSAYYPTLNGFVDLGSQAEDWHFNDQSRYVMVGLQLKIPIFEGNRRHHKLEQTRLELEKTQLGLKQLKRQLHLKSVTAHDQLRVALENFISAQKQLEAATAYQRLIERGYKAGTNTYIETVDARQQLTEAQVAVSINRLKMKVAQAQLERQTATYSF